MLIVHDTGHIYDLWFFVKMRNRKNDDTREENTRLRHGFSRGMWLDMKKHKWKHIPIFKQKNSLIKASLNTLRRENHKTKREYVDRGVGGLLDGYSTTYEMIVIT
ncbi:Hypothetical protein PHPALM_6940 [Phytophthora palmivora]|uniref:Uncharacterized protein n=1 Tax=Phytophthora palmivora TaxID=4796 RepID=A0A2P4YDK6_9STRA|nr:Hypothetical protein PHPALM_6940 [Phytophthora palmivora]